MGGFVSVLRYFFWTSPPSDAETTRQRALDQLRTSERLLASKVEAKRMGVGDVDREIIEIGLRKQHAGFMSSSDAQTFRALYRHREVLLDARQRLLDVHGNVKAQLMIVEDSQAFVASAEALRSGVRDNADDVAAIESLMADVSRSAREIMSRQRNTEALERISRDVNQLDDAALERDLEHLMSDSAFIGQFDAADVERARADIALRLPSAPTHEPTAAPAAATAAAVSTRTEALSEMGM